MLGFSVENTPGGDSPLKMTARLHMTFYNEFSKNVIIIILKSYF